MTETIERSVLPKHLSSSAATMFNQCPQRWKLRYVDRLADPPGIPALVGTLAHRVLELLLNEPAEQRSQARARELATNAWAEISDHNDFVGLGLDTEGVRGFKWQAWHAIVGLWALEDPSAVGVVATEQRIEADLEGVPFLGVVDRVDKAGEEVVVTDYKSGKLPHALRTEEKLDQVLLYAAAIDATTDLHPARARLLYLGAKVIEVAVTPAAVQRAVTRLASTWSSLNDRHSEDHFPPKTGPLCGWCPFIERCPEGMAEIRSRVAEGRVPAHAPALRLVA